MLKNKVYLKDSAIDGLNPHHFETHGRIYEVDVIDYCCETVSVSTPSSLEFAFKDVKFLRNTGKKDEEGNDIYEDDILQVGIHKFIAFWDDSILSWRVRSYNENNKLVTYYCANLYSLKSKIVGNINNEK